MTIPSWIPARKNRPSTSLKETAMTKHLEHETASTVLTDERIEMIAHQAYLAGSLPSWSGFKKDAEGKYKVPAIEKMHCELIREIAAQVWQIAVPEGFVIVPMVPTAEMVEAMADEEWKWEDLLAAAEAITEDEYNYIANAPSPAKESK